MSEIELKERKPTWDYMLNDLAFISLKTKVLYGIFTNQERFDFEYQIELKDKEIERLNKELEEKEAILGCIQQLEAEIERLNNIIKDINKTLEDNYGGLPIVEYERLIDLTKGSESNE